MNLRALVRYEQDHKLSCWLNDAGKIALANWQKGSDICKAIQDTLLKRDMGISKKQLLKITEGTNFYLKLSSLLRGEEWK